MDLGDLLDDAQIKEKLLNLHSSIDEIEKILEVGLKQSNYDRLNELDKVNYDLFNSYALNILVWMYLRTKGQDPNNTSIKHELTRIKDYMLKAKAIEDKRTMPRLNKAAAGRFIKHGLNYSDSNEESTTPKKRKFND